MEIPANVQYRNADEAAAVTQVVENGSWAGGGYVCQRVERSMRSLLDDAHVVLTPSGTAALELALLVLGIGRNDEVILPTLSSPAPANAIIRCGGTPVFADVRSDSLNLDPRQLIRHITDKTKAIIVGHYGGISAEMKAIKAIADQHALFVIEDASLGFSSTYNGKPLGTLAHIGCFNFDENNIISCGEGGAIVTRSDVLAQQARLLQHNDAGQTLSTDAFNWQTAGGNFVMSDILAAVLEVQLGKLGDIKAKRRAIWQEYHDSLEVLAANGFVILPDVPPNSTPNYISFFFRVADQSTRNLLLTQLQGRGIYASTHYVPLHQTPYGEQFAREALPAAESRSKTLLRLPIYPDLSPRAARSIVRSIEKFFAPTQKEYDSLQSKALDRIEPGLAT